MKNRQSQIALDWVVFFLSDVETGVGPFMAGYFTAVRHWNPAAIGMIIAAQKIASVAAQASAGWLIDRTTYKKWLMAAAALVISCGSAFIVWSPGVISQIVNQAAVGVATAMASLLIAALSLGLVGREALGRRLGRNGAFSHTGNMLTASIAGYLGFRLGQQWIFYISALLGVACTASACAIRGRDVDDEVAREAPQAGVLRGATAAGFSELLRDRRVLTFAAVIVLFHVTNSALLPLAGEEISVGHDESSSLYLTLSIVFPQVVMIPVALLSGRSANRFGRKPILLIGMAALVLRGVLFALSANPNFIVAVEALDGIGTGIAGVLTVLIVSDLAKGTGRFNALGGLMQSGLGVGAFLGNLLAGIATEHFGFAPTFYGLSVVALCALVLFWLAMPETGDFPRERPSR